MKNMSEISSRLCHPELLLFTIPKGSEWRALWCVCGNRNTSFIKWLRDHSVIYVIQSYSCSQQHEGPDKCNL